MEVKINLSNSEHKDLLAYCNLNDLLISEVVKKSFISGFNIERYGLLGNKEKPLEVIKEVEVVREVPVEVVKEVEIIKEIIREVPGPTKEVKVVEYVDREVIIEVPVEKVVEKIVNIYDNSQVDELIGKTEQLDSQNRLFSTKIQELEQQVEEFSTKKSEMENIFQNEKNELLLKIQQLESRDPERVEVIVEKTVVDEKKQKMLEETLHTLRTDLIIKDKKIKELEDKFSEYQKNKINLGATYLRGSNLDNTLYK